MQPLKCQLGTCLHFLLKRSLFFSYFSYNTEMSLKQVSASDSSVYRCSCWILFWDEEQNTGRWKPGPSTLSSQFFSTLVWTHSFVISVGFFFCSALLFSLMLSLFCCLSSVFSQAKNKMRAWVHLVLLWNAIWSPECQPVLGCHLRHSLSQRYGHWGLSSATHSSFYIHPSSSEMRKVP